MVFYLVLLNTPHFISVFYADISNQNKKMVNPGQLTEEQMVDFYGIGRRTTLD